MMPPAKSNLVKPICKQALFLPLAACAEDENLMDNEIAVAQLGHQVCGFVAYTKHQLAWLYAAPSHFGQGVGQHLIRHVLSKTDRPLDVQMLDGNDRAKRLYEFMGFKLLKRTQGYIEGKDNVPANGLVLRLR